MSDDSTPRPSRGKSPRLNPVFDGTPKPKRVADPRKNGVVLIKTGAKNLS